jgi:TetR/AcrR family transcriptional regulator, copper-responsive repressor
MARPREFEEDRVVSQALRVFWTKGFVGATVSDLSAATGLGRASLYAAFGDKEGLLLATISHYRTEFRKQVAFIDQRPTPMEWLRMFFKMISDQRGRGKPRGCFVQACTEQKGYSNRETKNALADANAETQEMLSKCVSKGQKDGVIIGDRSAADITSFLVMLVHGVNSSGCAGRSVANIQQDITIALDAISS